MFLLFSLILGFTACGNNSHKEEINAESFDRNSYTLDGFVYFEKSEKIVQFWVKKRELLDKDNNDSYQALNKLKDLCNNYTGNILPVWKEELNEIKEQMTGETANRLKTLKEQMKDEAVNREAFTGLPQMKELEALSEEITEDNIKEYRKYIDKMEKRFFELF